MIKYNLICECGKIFESWFSNSKKFDSLSKKKLINCIYCESSSVKKSVMAPNLSSKSNKSQKKVKLEKYNYQHIKLKFTNNHYYYNVIIFFLYLKITLLVENGVCGFFCTPQNTPFIKYRCVWI